MFDFEKLDIYQVIKTSNSKVLKYITEHPELDEYFKDEWKRSNMNIILNLVEGTGRMSNTEKKEYLTTARVNVFTSVAILDILKELKVIEEGNYKEYYDSYEQISKMLLGMIRSYS